MARSKISRGTCLYCEKEFAKSGITKHLNVCPQHGAAIEKAEAGKGASETLHYLRVKNAGNSAFWLELEMRGSASLNDLDKYLRGIWLECCGHLSAFYSGYGRETAKRRRIDEVFEYNTTLRHIYDFGSSTETEIENFATREGKPTTRHPIVLMARNLRPEVECMECGKPAEWLCMECVSDQDEEGTFCAERIKSHPHDDYGEPLLLVNSPRMGVCGYDGDAEPPY